MQLENNFPRQLSDDKNHNCWYSYLYQWYFRSTRRFYLFVFFYKHLSAAAKGINTFSYNVNCKLICRSVVAASIISKCLYTLSFFTISKCENLKLSYLKFSGETFVFRKDHHPYTDKVHRNASWISLDFIG